MMIAINLLLLFVFSVEMRLVIGFIWYMYGTAHCDHYEDRWQLFGFGYHIKETTTETFFKLGFFK